MAYERKTYDIIVSDELKSVLSEFESDSLVAKLLLKKRHDKESLVEDPVNFISIAHDKSKISYLTADRIEKLEPEQYWSSSRRFAARPGAFIAKIFKDIPSKEVEKFSNLYRSHTNKVFSRFEVVSGDTILRYYHIDSYAAERGTLGASCMKYDSCQNFLGIYTENSDVVKMLVLLNVDNKLLGRALIWQIGDKKIMDRIYTVADEEYLFQFKKWATDNGYLYKSEQNWYNTLNFENLSTSKQEIQLEIDLNEFEFRRYPYVDTFKFLDLNGKLTNYLPEVSHKTLTSSDGGYNGSNSLVLDGIDRVLRHPGDCVYIKYLDIRTHCNNARWSEVNDEYILEKDSKYDEEIGEYLFNEEYDRFNKSERINERREYYRKRREEMEKRESSPRRTRRSGSWIESLVSSQGLDANSINEIYQAITERTGIPQGYFTYDYRMPTLNVDDEAERPQTDSEPQAEPVE